MSNENELVVESIFSEKPIEAISYFWISKFIIQQIIFKYYDPEMNYRRMEEENDLEDELQSIKENMQFFIDQDSFYLNNKLLSFSVEEVRLEYKDKNNYHYPILKFRIKSLETINISRKEKNFIDLDAEIEIAEYPITIHWFAPKKFFEIQSGMKITESEKNRLVLSAEPGMVVGGQEKIAFF